MMKRIPRYVLFAVLAFVLVFVVAFALYWKPDLPDLDHFRAAHPAAYDDSPYYSAAFLDEQKRAYQGVYLDNDNYWQHPDFSGTWFNFRGGFRVVVGQPSNAPHTIYILGNSLVTGMEVPDALTIPSRLQAAMGARYKVVSLDGLWVSQSQRYMDRLALAPGDVVIWYFGVAEMAALANIHEGHTLSEQATIEAHRIYTAIQHGRRTTTQHGAAFYAFLEPSILAIKPSAYEQSILDNPKIVFPEALEGLRTGWPVLQRLAPANGVIDFTHALDEMRQSGREVYLDAAHVTERANMQIVANMLTYITDF